MKQHLAQITVSFDNHLKRLTQKNSDLETKLKDLNKKMKSAKRTLDWQDREIDRLLGILKQKRLHVDVKTTTNF